MRTLGTRRHTQGTVQAHTFAANTPPVVTVPLQIDGAPAYVLRKKPPGVVLPSAHAVEREYRVLTALQGTPVPVPLVVRA